MTNVVQLRVLSETLVDEFVLLAIEQGASIENNDSRRANSHFDKAVVIENKLMARGDKRMLLPLLEHPDPWVRFFSATKIFAEAPETASQVLEDLRAAKTPLTSFYAAKPLRHLDDGVWVPK